MSMYNADENIIDETFFESNEILHHLTDFTGFHYIFAVLKYERKPNI